VSEKTVAIMTMGCARNEVDSEELAARLESQGWTLVKDPEHAEAVMVNTCGFVDIAKADSINTIIEAADLKESGGVTKAVVAVGCLAQRYGSELASDLPEADAVLSFDDYPKIGASALMQLCVGKRSPPTHPAIGGRYCPLAQLTAQPTPLRFPDTAPKM
jgi:ribosomal protein S12 methylthiotransferase